MKHAKPMPEGYSWCPDCGASQPKGHRCKDPIDLMTRDELLALVRVLRLSAAQAATEFISARIDYETALIHAAWNEGRKAQRAHNTDDLERIRSRAAATSEAGR